MTRFEDRTTNWFEKGEDPMTLASVDLIEVQPKRPVWPFILGGVAGATALAACAFVLIGRRSPELAAQPAIAAAPTPATGTPCGVTPPASPAPGEPASSAAASAENPPAADPALDAGSTKPATVATDEDQEPAPARPTKKSTRVASRVHGKARLAPKATRAKVALTPEVASGERLLARGQNGAALEHFQRELAHNPKDTRALRGACSALGHMGRVNDAARVCRHELALAPNDVDTRAHLAAIYYEGGAYKWSANEWKRVLASRPHDSQALHGLKQAQTRL